MRAPDLWHGTLQSLRAHALRFSLTASGVVWGTAMLAIMFAYTDGFDRHFQREIGKVGARIVYTFPGVEMKDRIGERGARPIELENEDAERVAALAGVEAAAPNLWAGLRVHRFERISKLLWVQGVTEQSQSIRSFEPASGRFINARDVAEAARVVYLGAAAAERVFGTRAAVGRSVHIDGIPFTVIGVGRRKGDQVVNMGPKDDELSLIPVTTAQRRFTKSDHPGVIIFSPMRREESQATIANVREVLGLEHEFRPGDDRAVSFFDIQEAAGLIEALGAGVSLFTTAAGLITLLVGAIGVMNVMLVVVGERTREVGLRKALGASDRAIFLQFLAESVAVTAVAGALGGLLGGVAVRALASAISPDNPMSPRPYLEPETVVMMAALLVAVGVVAGVVPARRAARIDPAISLRAI
jgi:putative ABC transport system permease protein